MRNIPFILILLLFAHSACQRSYTPKPRGYLRIDFPEKEYTLFDSTCPYLFEFPVYAQIVADTSYLTEPCWINLVFPSFDGTLHISYKEVSDYLEFTLRLLFKKHIFCEHYSPPATFFFDTYYIAQLLYRFKI